MSDLHRARRTKLFFSNGPLLVAVVSDERSCRDRRANNSLVHSFLVTVGAGERSFAGVAGLKYFLSKFP